MNSKSHLLISLVKSMLRILSIILTLSSSSILPIAYGFLLAEILGIFEELVDKR